jgi:hypothetical protein
MQARYWLCLAVFVVALQEIESQGKLNIYVSLPISNYYNDNYYTLSFTDQTVFTDTFDIELLKAVRICALTIRGSI